VKILTIIAWISLPTVMYGGFSLLQFLTRPPSRLSDWQLGMFRAGHAHAGVLLLMTLLYMTFIQQTPYSATLQVLFSLLIVVGVLMQSGGFFLHMALGSAGRASVGSRLTMLGAVVLALGVIALVVGLVQA
jgi:hypothetical protein